MQLELVQISKFYLTKELENHVIIKVNNFKVTMETILTALEAVLAYKSLDGFEGICSVLNLKGRRGVKNSISYGPVLQPNPKSAIKIVFFYKEKKMILRTFCEIYSFGPFYVF